MEKARRKGRRKVLDYIVWKIDSDNIGEDLTKEREGNDGGNTSCARSSGRIFFLATFEACAYTYVTHDETVG